METVVQGTQVEGEKESKCGCGYWHPACLQKFSHPVAFLLCISAAALAQSILVSGYTSSILTTIEKRYSLQSTELGVIFSSYEFTCVFFTVIVSYFGGRSKHNRAAWIGKGMVLLALGSFLFALPHFIGGQYQVTLNQNASLDNTENLCNDDPASTDMSSACRSSVQSEKWAFAIFLIAQMLIGVGASPVYTLGPTYMYDNVRRNLYPIYAGIMYAMAAFGPALGFLVGAAFITLYVDPADPPPTLTEDSKDWVGAWWLGFLLCSFMGLLVSGPLLMFPKKLDIKEEENVEVEEEPAMMGFGQSVKDIPRELKKLFTNTTWLCVSLAIVMEQSVIQGFIVFIAKYLQTMYDIPASRANIVTGAVVIPSAVVGIITGGVVVKKFKLTLEGIGRLLVCIAFLAFLVTLPIFFLGCESGKLAGVTTPYRLDDVLSTVNLSSECNVNCHCSVQNYAPVCDSHAGMAYLSACHAGCHVVDVTHIDEMTESVKNYSSCACLGLSSLPADGWSVVEGKCSRECNTFIPFVLLLFLVVFLICCAQNPALIITLKSVSSSSERSFALGMQYFLLRAMAFIPAPIYFGYLFDTQCILWQPSCENGKQGACWEYSIENLPYTMFGMACGLRVLGFIFILLTYLSIKRDGRRKGCMQIANGGKEDLDPNKMVHSVSTVSCDTMTSSVSSDIGVKPVRLDTYI